MWWPDGNWIEAHDSAGATVTSSRWALAEGEVGGTRSTLTYVLHRQHVGCGWSGARSRSSTRIRARRDAATYTVPARAASTSTWRASFRSPKGAASRCWSRAWARRRRSWSSSARCTRTPATTVWAAGTNALATPLFADNTFTVTANGVYPKVLVVDEGPQVTHHESRSERARDRSTAPQGGHDISDDPHPTHGDYPAFGASAASTFGESRVTQNLVDPGVVRGPRSLQRHGSEVEGAGHRPGRAVVSPSAVPAPTSCSPTGFSRRASNAARGLRPMGYMYAPAHPPSCAKLSR